MGDLSGWLNWGAIVCGVMFVVWLARFQKDATRAKIMASAFLTLGILFVGMARAWPTPYLIGLGVLLILLLFVDFATRAAKLAREKE